MPSSARTTPRHGDRRAAGARSAAPPGGERRRGERRRSERARPGVASWFLDTSTFGAADSQLPQEEPPWLLREARRIVRSGQTSFERLYGGFIAARIAIGVLLVLAQSVGILGGSDLLKPIVVCAIYALQAVAVWMLEPSDSRLDASSMASIAKPRWLATIGFDVVGFTTLQLLESGSGLNYAALLVMPVLMSAMLTPRPLALATTAAVALALLALAGWRVLAHRDAVLVLTQAGLGGAGLFVLTLLANEIAGRLGREEQAARSSFELARQQVQLNRLVIEAMSDGVLVVDERDRVRAANPAGRALLVPQGLCRPAPFMLHDDPAWAPLAQALRSAFAEEQWPDAGEDVELPFGSGAGRVLRVRVRFTRRSHSNGTERVCVVFLEDVLRLQARARNEKLAAMGRVSAAIAHEIRNPLAAIAQANALLAEDAADPTQRRLTSMVADNVERLRRIVDDVLEAVPGARAGSALVIDASAAVASIAADWAATNGIEPGRESLLDVRVPQEPLNVVFDPEHLRRVLVNLLDNGRRHGSSAPGAVRVVLEPEGPDGAVLGVASDGAPIPAEVERYLFEPFFSTRSRGTGLGLYICRELCERYGARVEYHRHPSDASHPNEFVIVLRRAAQQE